MHRSLSKDNLAGASAMPGAMATAALRVMPGAMAKDNVKVHESEPTSESVHWKIEPKRD